MRLTPAHFDDLQSPFLLYLQLSYLLSVHRENIIYDTKRYSDKIVLSH